MTKPDYRLCDTPVTVYHCDEDGNVTRTVYPRAFLEWKEVRSTHRTAGKTVSKIGMSEQTQMLLVIPCESESCPVRTGDKVLRGEGPSAGAVDWATFTPALWDGLAVVRWTSLHFWRGKPCHLEAGG